MDYVEYERLFNSGNDSALLERFFHEDCEFVATTRHLKGRKALKDLVLTLRRIVLPQAMRAILPAVGNDAISVLKGTSLASVIAVNELTLRSQQIVAQNFKFFPVFAAAGVMYLAVTTLIAGAVAVLVLYLLLQMYRVANPAVLARALKIAGGIVALAIAAFVGLRGGLAIAIPLGLFGAGLLGWAPFGGGQTGFGNFGNIGDIFGPRARSSGVRTSVSRA